MSNTIDTLPEHLVELSKQEPLTIREKIVNIFEELEGTKDEQRQVNTELDKEMQARMEAETEASHLRRQVQLVEVNLDNTTNRVNHLTPQLTEVVKVSEAAQHMCTDLENKSIVVKDKVVDLDDELKKAKECSIETDKRFQENANKLTELQQRNQHAECRSTIAEQRNAGLEKDIQRAYVEMKLLNQTEEKAHTKEEQQRKHIEELQGRLKSAQHRTDEAETDVGKLQYKADKLKEKLAGERNKCHKINKMINDSSSP